MIPFPSPCSSLQTCPESLGLVLLLLHLHKVPLVASSMQDAAPTWRERKAWNNIQAEIHRAHEAAVKLHYKCEPLGYSSDPSQQRRIF